MMRYCDLYWKDVKKTVQNIPDITQLFHKSICITGANGMICSAIADIILWLNCNKNAGIHLILAGRSNEKIKKRFLGFEKFYTFAFYDATQFNSICFQADYIIHGACNANPAKYVKEPVETMLANFMGLDCLLKSAVKNKSNRVVYISSSEVYGSKLKDQPYQESDYGYVDLLNPGSCYPSSKRASETLCSAYTSEYGLDTVVVRPGHIYGPTITDTDDRASAQFTRCAVEGKDIVIKSAGTQLRSYCYVLDCASAILTVLLSGESGQAYNISNPNSIVSIAQLAKAFAATVGKNVLFEQANAEEQKGYNKMMNSSLDSTKLEALGWKALFSLQEGTSKTIQILKTC